MRRILRREIMDKKTLIEKIENEHSSVEFYNLKGDILRHLKDNPKSESRRAELSKLNMKELREIGLGIGAKDTSKNDLIEEIILKEGN
jgi:hypothetical protein